MAKTTLEQRKARLQANLKKIELAEKIKALRDEQKKLTGKK